MPQAIAGFLIAAVGATGAAAALITVVVAVGFAIGTNALIGAVFGGGQPKPTDGQQNVKAAIGSRRRHYGIVHTGGQLSFLESRRGRIALVVTLGTGREGPIIEHRINDKPVTLDATGKVTTSGYRGAVRVLTRDGSDDQTAIGELTAAFPEWTADHRQRGCAHAAIIGNPVKQEHFSEVYGSQVPQYTQVRHGAALYDPRLDSTAIIGRTADGDPIHGDGPVRLDTPGGWPWSDNAALVIADYFAHPDGYGAGYDNVNWANIAREADFSDAAETTIGGDIIGRWRIWASYSLASEERRQVLTNMLIAVDGFCWQDADGLFNLMTGRWEAPGVVLTDDHILGMTATLGPKARHGTDAIKVLYTEAAIGYREDESTTIVNPEAVDDPNTSPQALTAYFIPHHNQACRIGVITLAQLGTDRWHIVARINLFGLNLLGERFTRLASDQLGVDAYFKVSSLKLDLVKCAVEVTLDEVRPSDWDFDPAMEVAPPTGGDGGVAMPPLAAPTGLAVSADQLSLGETNAVQLRATWDDPDRADLIHEAQYRVAGGPWVTMAVDQDAHEATSGATASGIEHEVRVRAVTITMRSSAWSASVTITPIADTTLAAPTDLSAQGDGADIVVTFRLPSSPSFDFARLYRADTVDFADAVQVGDDRRGALGEVVAVTDAAVPAGSKYYWAAAFQADGTSALAGPALAERE
ncbi:hypothetical protein [Sphingomonas sp. VNH70]|uniref:hypothetical protein n=1 Tax=Sphingomonas silueang TaxID=3156617 RepID=UPI0032B42647